MCLSVCAVAFAADTVDVVYTGRLLGHFRHPSIQTTTLTSCPESDPTGHAATMLKLVGKHPKSILVGMGDNFAPQLEARTFRDNGVAVPKEHLVPTKAGSWVAASRQNSVAAAALPVPVDNVGCFLKRAGYAAVVPGKHDFYFGIARLRHLAQYLGVDEKASGYSTTRMLGSNLAVQTSRPAAPPAVTAWQRKEKWWADSAGLNGTAITISLPEVVYPWLPSVTVENIQSGGKGLVTEAWLCDSQSADPDDLLPPPHADCRKLTQTPVPGEATRLKLTISPGLLTYAKPQAICLAVDPSALPDPKKRFYCRQFSAVEPLFAGNPWHVRDNVAIFAVVDRNFQQLVAGLNARWRNMDEKLDTSLAVHDPAESLRQALEACEADDACMKVRSKILLAEMPSSQANLLASRLHGEFDLIVTSAAPEGTGDESRTVRFVAGNTVSHTLAAGQGSSGSTHDHSPTFLVVPQQMKIGTPDTLDARLNHASVTKDSQRFTLEHWFEEERSKDAPATPICPATNAAGTTLRQEMIRILSERNGPDARTWTTTQIAQRFALEVMRKRGSSDVALLQTRDVFAEDHYLNAPLCKENLQDLLERLYWKNDHAVTFDATPDTLKALLERSKQYALEDKLLTSAERGRAVVTLGLLTDSDTKKLIFNGANSLGKALYSVTAPDHMVMSDTGYPGLATVAELPARRIDEWVVRGSLASLVCEEIRQHGSALRSATCTGPAHSDALWDWTQAKPSTVPQHQSFGLKLSHWLAWNKRPAGWIYRNQTDQEVKAQHRDFWSVQLDKAEGGFSLFQHGLSPQEQKDKFGDVQLAQAKSAVNDMVNTALRLRVQYRQLFFQTDGAWTRTRQATQSGWQPTVTNNFYAVEAGYLHRMFPRRRDIRSWHALISLRGEIDVETGRVSFTPCAAPSVTTDADGRNRWSCGDTTALPALKGKGLREKLFVPKFGVRYNGESSFFEAGVQTGFNFNSIRGYRFGEEDCILPVARGQADMDYLNEEVEYQGCTTRIRQIMEGPNQPFTPLKRTLYQPGYFLNFKLKVPLGTMSWVIENRGDYYWKREGQDRRTDTSYFNVLGNSLELPVAGNFKLVPKVEWFAYRNKVVSHTFRAFQTTLSLQYRFDWRTGLEWRRVLRYPNPEIPR